MKWYLVLFCQVSVLLLVFLFSWIMIMIIGCGWKGGCVMINFVYRVIFGCIVKIFVEIIFVRIFVIKRYMSNILLMKEDGVYLIGCWKWFGRLIVVNNNCYLY